MAIDPYMLCPGGSGKKVKFCCPELVSDLDTISRMLSGSQPQACLDYLDKLEAKCPNRACLTAARLDALEALDRGAEAATVAEQFLAHHPDNPLALLEAGRRVAETQDVKWGVEMVQRAIASDSGQNVGAVVDALRRLGISLAANGYPVAASGHLRLALAFAPNDQDALRLWMSLSVDPSLSTIVKDDPPLKMAPDDAPWKADFDAAMEFIRKGIWVKAAERLTTITQRVTAAPAVWHNLAVVRGWLADDAGAQRAWRRYAALDIPLEDAVEAELRAAAYERDDPDAVAEMAFAYGVTNFDEVMLRLAGEMHAMAVQAQPREREGSDDSPPPRAAYLLLDRPRNAADESPVFDNFPRLLGVVTVYGKQTDREARLNLTAFDDVAPAARDRLLATCGDALGDLIEEVVIDRIHSVDRLLRISAVIPPHLSDAERRDVNSEHIRRALMEIWPDKPSSALGGRSPREAASDPATRNRVMALVLELELAASGSTVLDFNRLRTLLGLPEAEPITAVDRGTHISLARLHRVEPAGLDDQTLAIAAHRAISSRSIRAIERLLDELNRREGIADEVKHDLTSMAFELVEDPRLAQRLLEAARELTLKLGRSCAVWDLREMGVRAQMGDGRRLGQIVQHIQSDHLREPGVRDALFGLLGQLGLLPNARDQEEMAVAPLQEVAAEPKKLWTPDAERAASPKSALWTPGSD